MKKKYLYWIVFLIALSALLAIFGFGLFFADDPKTIPSNLIQKPAPNFSLTTFSGKKIKLNELQGKPVILNFFASWCVPCRREFIEQEEAWQNYKNQAHFLAVAINDSTEAAKKFVLQTAVTFHTAKDDEDGNIALEYGVTGIPETFFIDAEGIIQEKFSGAITREVIEKFLQTEIVELEGRVLEIAHLLRCPVCQGLSVKESQDQISLNMKKKISNLIAEGKSKKEILVFFEERYGEWILRNPKKAGFNVSLWLLPFGVILAAVFLVGWFLKKNIHRK